MTGDGAHAGARSRKFSARDAARSPDYGERLEAIADVLRDLVLETPPNVTDGGWLHGAAGAAARRAHRRRGSRKLDMTLRRDLLALVRAVGRRLSRRLVRERRRSRRCFGFDGVVGNYASPYTPGSAYVLLHHVFGEVNGKKGAWGHAIGGMGAITQAMAQAARRARRRDPPRERRCGEVIVEGGPRRRRRHRARARRCTRAARDLQPQSEAAVRAADRPHGASPATSASACSRYRCGSGTFRMNVALSELPRFHAACRAAAPPITTPPASSWRRRLAYMDRAYLDARADGWSQAADRRDC